MLTLIGNYVRVLSRSQAFVLLALSLLELAVPPAGAQDIDLMQPKGHLTIERPRMLSDPEAASIYQNIRGRMQAGYRHADIAAAAEFGDWLRYNRVPYLSATHGQRYVNNYANPLARSYGRYEQSGPMPVGAILAKDSFTVIRSGEVFAGALFLMEKMPIGFNPESHDWRYTMVMPDRSLFGTTNGEGSEHVSFCISCHEAVGEEQHQLFFVPPAYRIEFLSSE